MEEQASSVQQDSSSSSTSSTTVGAASGNNTPERNNEQPVRSRWNPKPEQILILESIFNSGMVNPPKEETVRIRKLLEQFGSVGDANVFYWFQNRRSRSRRRQRQLQASIGTELAQQHQQGGGSDASSGCVFPSLLPPNNNNSAVTNNNYFLNLLGSSSSSSCCAGALDDEMLCLSGGGETMVSVNSAAGIEPCAYQQPGLITVFINGVATEVPRGPIDMKIMFGEEDLLLYHSSGIPIPINEFGILFQSLRHGESYFLVSRTAQPSVN